MHDVRDAYKMACEAHAGQWRDDGTPYVNHVIEVAEIVGQWHADRDTIIAALLHDVLEDAPIQKDTITLRFGRHVAMLVDGVTKFSNADLDHDLPLDRKTETLRKLFDVMRRDIRVAVIKLADRLHNIYTIDTLSTPERRTRFSLETLHVYHKLALHLGMRQVRQIYADFCVPYAFPEDGGRAKTLRDALCMHGELLLPSLERQLRAEAESSDVLSVELQPRDLLKFLHRMRDRMWQPSASDAFSIVLVVRSEEACYRLLKHIHTLFRPVSGQFRDYIAAPAESGYKSLHTHVTLPDGMVVDIRVRTTEMHAQALYGVTTFLFRGAGAGPKFSWLQRSEEIDLHTRESSGDFWDALESDILRETIWVSVDRQRIAIPKDATVLDAIYVLYRERAANTQHVSVNGQTVELSQVLKQDDDIYVMMSPIEQMHFDWLKYVKTKLARSLIVDVLKHRDASEKLRLGMKLLQHELDFYNKGLVSDLPKNKQQQIAEHFRRHSFEDVISMIGEGVLRAREVVFFLYPEHRRFLFPNLFKRKGYAFRLRLSGTVDRQRDAQVRLNQLVEQSDVAIRSTQLRFDETSKMFVITVSGTGSDRSDFSNFVELLERQQWITSVRTLIPLKEIVRLSVYILFALALVVTDLVVYGMYQHAVESLDFLPRFFLEGLPLVPIFLASYYTLRILRQYVIRMRSDKWFLGVGFLLNLSGLGLIIVRMMFSSNTVQSLFPLMAIFILSLFYFGYSLSHTESFLSLMDTKQKKPRLSKREWKMMVRKKMIGYTLRLGAVILWGLQPLMIKYTPAHDVPLSLRVALIWLGVFLVGIVPVALSFIFSLLRRVPTPKLSLPLTKELGCIILAYLIFMVCFNIGLQYTTSTNVIVLNSFSPVLALFVGMILWRQSMPYLKDPKYVAWIFLAFILGSAGGSLIVYHDMGNVSGSHIWGDIFAIGAMSADTMLALSQIRYMRVAQNSSSLALNIVIAFCLLMITVPVALPVILSTPALQLSAISLWWALGVGILTGIGQILNYETFRRIDGYIAFLMFNISILVTFVIEVFFLGKFAPHWILLLGAVTVVGSTLIAETINTLAQRRGL